VLARVSHSISSPVYTWEDWRNAPHWGRLKQFQFEHVLRYAGEVFAQETSRRVV
jgi:hypothetical protein